MFRKHTSSLVSEISQGLKQLPQLTSTQPHQEGDSKKLLLEAAQQLEKAVILPMNSLAQSNLFYYEMLQQRFAAQQKLLKGTNGSTAASSSSPAKNNINSHDTENTQVSLASSGLEGMLTHLENQNEVLVNRIKELRTKFERLQEGAERTMTLAISQKTKVYFVIYSVNATLYIYSIMHVYLCWYLYILLLLYLRCKVY